MTEPIWVGVALLDSCRFPSILDPQIWFVVDAEATFWIARFPPIVLNGPMENAAAPWIWTLPVIAPRATAKFPPFTLTFPVTPPPSTNEQFWPEETVMFPLNVPS